MEAKEVSKITKSELEYADAPSRAQEKDLEASGYKAPFQKERDRGTDTDVADTDIKDDDRRSATYGTYTHGEKPNADNIETRYTSFGNFDSFEGESKARWTEEEADKYADYAKYRQADRERNASNVQGEFAGRIPGGSLRSSEVHEASPKGTESRAVDLDNVKEDAQPPQGQSANQNTTVQNPGVNDAASGIGRQSPQSSSRSH
ncbi:MAG: hypothetical protein ABIR96_05450 [Bdellovibrionota bacterium]